LLQSLQKIVLYVFVLQALPMKIKLEQFKSRKTLPKQKTVLCFRSKFFFHFMTSKQKSLFFEAAAFHQQFLFDIYVWWG
jgi:hypothetical protein